MLYFMPEGQFLFYALRAILREAIFVMDRLEPLKGVVQK